MCNVCGKKGHAKDDCWKVHPEKAPQWFQDLQKKKEASGSSVEVVLASVKQLGNDNATEETGWCTVVRKQKGCKQGDCSAKRDFYWPDH